MKVLLKSVGNPDFGQDPTRPMFDVPTRTVRVTDLAHASQVCRQYIRQYELGAGNWSGGMITDDHGKEVGRVSYNGKVWPPTGPSFTNAEPLYDPRKTPAKSPPQYHLLNYFGVYKATIKKNFHDNDRSGEEAERVHALLNRRGQLYTLEEVKLLSGYLWTAHDDCVDENPDEYTPLQVKTSRDKIDFGRTVLEKIKQTESLERNKLI